MRQSESIKTISAALQKFAEEVDVVHKSKKVSKKSGELMYKYATLESVMDTIAPALASNGLVYLQTVDICDTCAYVETVIRHTESEEWISCRVPALCVRNNDPQALGSGITYARRYGLMTALRLKADDDDGAAGSKPQKKPVSDSVIQSANFNRAIAGKPSAKAAIYDAGNVYLLTDEQKNLIESIWQDAHNGEG